MGGNTTTQDTTSAGRPSVLDRRRRKLQDARAAADGARTAVERIEEQIVSGGARRGGLDADLRAALDQVAGLKKAIKATDKESERLRGARKQARQRAATLRQRAADAESRYDDAVLADLVRREKESDLAAHAPRGDRTGDAPDTAGRATGQDEPASGSGDVGAGPVTAAQGDPARGTGSTGADTVTDGQPVAASAPGADADAPATGEPATGEPATEEPATDTARATAARRTAARAGTGSRARPRTARAHDGDDPATPDGEAADGGPSGSSGSDL